jgi:hypothetical protein
MGIAAAIGATAVVASTGASLYGASKAASAAKSAANSNNDLQAQIYAENQQALSPYEAAGNSATEQLQRLLGLGDSNTGKSVNGVSYTAAQQQQGAIDAFQQGAPYQAELNTGLKSVQAALGAQGLTDSGAAQKSLLSYGDNFLSGQLNTYEGQLAALGGQGLTAASAQAGVGQGYANAVSANNNAAATATGNAALSGASGVNSALGSALSGYEYSQGLNSSYGGGSALSTASNAGAQYGVAAPGGSYWG